MAEFLYIHIPFCVKKCLYCDFLSIPYDGRLAERYVDALCCELKLRKHSIGEIKAVYVGGGTPSTLSHSGLKQLFDCVKDNLRVSPLAEITVEANPGTLNEQYIQTMLSAGANRISMGIQSFNDRELKALGRIHSADEARLSARLIRRCGMQNLSLDLMYGIPGQTLKTWKETLAAAVELSPSHISSYELTPSKGTPTYDQISSGTVSLPDEDTIIQMYGYAIDYLASAGYDHYEISNFAVPGAACLHNLNYWNRGDYVGAGAGAHSFVRGVRFANTGNIEEYLSCLNEAVLPHGDQHLVSPPEAAKEFLFLGLRKREGIDMKEAAEKGIDIIPHCREMFDQGYLVANGTHVSLTGKGLLISNTVIVRLFELLGL